MPCWCCNACKSFGKSPVGAPVWHTRLLGHNGPMWTTAVPLCSSWCRLTGLWGAQCLGQRVVPVPDAGLLRACPISHMGCCLLRRKIITARGNSRKLSFLLGYLSLGAPESLAGSTQVQWGEPVAAASSS